MPGITLRLADTLSHYYEVCSNPCHAEFLPIKGILKLSHLSRFQGPPQGPTCLRTESRVSSTSMLGMEQPLHGRIYFATPDEAFFRQPIRTKIHYHPRQLAEGLKIGNGKCIIFSWCPLSIEQKGLVFYNSCTAVTTPGQHGTNPCHG